MDGVLFNKRQDTIIKYPTDRIGSYVIPNSVTNIGFAAFSDSTSLTNITLGRVLSIGDWAFWGCTGLTNVTITDSVTDLGISAFGGCSSLTNVTIGTGVISIGWQGFYGCTSLASVAIPSSVKSIEQHAFSRCTGLTSITIPESVTNVGSSAFSGCNSLTSIEVAALNPAYISLNGVLFTKNQDTIIKYPAGRVGSYAIPNIVASVGMFAFEGCTGLINVTIPQSVTRIRDRAFVGCDNLTGAYFEGSAPSLGSDVFTNSHLATIYYLPGTTGWGPTFAGRPTAIWKPKVQADDASFGLQAGRFGFNIAWASDQVVLVEACADLVNPTWFLVGTNTLVGGSSYFGDPESANGPQRFYRLRSP